MTNTVVLLCTCPNDSVAEQLASGLLDQQLVACVNLLPGITSLYHWQGQLCREQETQLLIKTRSTQLPMVEQWLRQHHPYEVPEMLALPVQWGHQPYLEWIQQNC
ncbi:divalent-cation tolerance protein CutA [Ferrimonas senticii]|uniref:divalent-cation tolerance protein CutA n=1 Tax=Ferrimonas senticii TaxID=394566 RepID=UPI000423E871|nr:divalent-cation tolerance protein CutA [Ferrimonas senticii]